MVEEDWIQDVHIDAARKALKKKYKYNTLRRLSESGAIRIPRIPFKILNLDLAMGGGVPVGRVVMLWGKRSGCKSTLALKLMQSAQETDRSTFRSKYDPMSKSDSFRPMRCLYVDVEGTINQSWAISQGLDPETTLFSQPQHGEEAVDIISHAMRTNSVDLVVIDSLAFMIPIRELEESADDAMMGGHAKLVGRLCRKVSSAINAASNARIDDPTIAVPTVLMINQLRQKPGAGLGSPDVKPGGITQDHVSSIEIKLTPKSYKAPTNKTEDEVAGEIYKDLPFSFFTEKNKTFTPHLSGDFRMRNINDEDRIRGDFYEDVELVKHAISLGIVGKDSGWGVSNYSFNTKKELMQEIRKDPKLEHFLRTIVLEMSIPKLA